MTKIKKWQKDRRKIKTSLFIVFRPVRQGCNVLDAFAEPFRQEGLLQDQDDSPEAVLRQAKLRGGRPRHRYTDCRCTHQSGNQINTVHLN